MNNNQKNHNSKFEEKFSDNSRVSFGRGYQNIPDFTYYDEAGEEYAMDWHTKQDEPKPKKTTKEEPKKEKERIHKRKK